MKFNTDKGFFALAVLLVFAAANGWGMFWKIVVSVVAIMELLAIGAKALGKHVD